MKSENLFEQAIDLINMQKDALILEQIIIMKTSHSATDLQNWNLKRIAEESECFEQNFPLDLKQISSIFCAF